MPPGTEAPEERLSASTDLAVPPPGSSRESVPVRRRRG